MRGNSTVAIQGWLSGLEAEKQALLTEMDVEMNGLPDGSKQEEWLTEQHRKLEQIEALIFATQANLSLCRRKVR
ncbi:hypothetical protein SAMN05421743_115121 [Thalassobacillus cyri]|uniref:Uncharacterized protein n=1 Tax=Thalassobacillus cyri TaxID=571932 RepID=A0A1H4GF68_9BACI|nr:hypothetical protein [Thalassobacillus cyri]SEB08236.1 hypothetical protein SAMN05421743_115121 [Thalassobacillus cyri]